MGGVGGSAGYKHLGSITPGKLRDISNIWEVYKTFQFRNPYWPNQSDDIKCTPSSKIPICIPTHHFSSISSIVKSFSGEPELRHPPNSWHLTPDTWPAYHFTLSEIIDTSYPTLNILLNMSKGHFIECCTGRKEYVVSTLIITIYCTYHDLQVVTCDLCLIVTLSLL